MPRIQPSLSEAEAELVDQLASVTRAKRSDVVKDALAVYHWFVRQVVTGATVLARSPTGEETYLATPEFAVLESAANRLGPEELENLAEQLAKCTDPARAQALKERLTRGFYGI